MATRADVTESARFAGWLRSIDRLIANLGVDMDKLSDWDWYSAFRSGLSPNDALIAWRDDMLDAIFEQMVRDVIHLDTITIQ